MDAAIARARPIAQTAKAPPAGAAAAALRFAKAMAKRHDYAREGEDDEGRGRESVVEPGETQ